MQPGEESGVSCGGFFRYTRIISQRRRGLAAQQFDLFAISSLVGVVAWPDLRLPLALGREGLAHVRLVLGAAYARRWRCAQTRMSAVSRVSE